jgi:glycosyltransferase involved in cell wall biosynthesis
MDDVTVVIPCFNAAHTIEPCLKAVLAQSFPLKEVLVIDDGSSDETVDIVLRYPVRLIRHQSNLGLAAARNSGLKNTRSVFIASLDADCVPQADWLKLLVEKFDAPCVAGAGGKLCEAYTSNVCDEWRSVHMRQYWHETQSEPPFLFGSNTVFRHDVFSKIGLYDEIYKTNYEDVEICSRLRNAGYIFKYEPRAVANHLKRDTLISVLNNHWHWQLPYYTQENHFQATRFLTKIKTDFWTAQHYMEEDLKAGNKNLLYINFLMAVHHAFKDFEFFFFQEKKKSSREEASDFSRFVALMDLSFFYHMDRGRSTFLSLVPDSKALAQNFFAFSLLLSNCLRHQFRDSRFRESFFKDLFLSVFPDVKEELLKSFVALVEGAHDWKDIREKEHPHLDTSFLKESSVCFEEWVEGLRMRMPEMLMLLAQAAEATHREM